MEWYLDADKAIVRVKMPFSLAPLVYLYSPNDIENHLH